MKPINKRHLQPWVIRWSPLSRLIALVLVPVTPLMVATVIVWRERKSILRETADVFRTAIGRWE